MNHPAMKHFEIIDGNVINTLSIEHIEPVECGFATDDSDAEEGDVIGARIITHNSTFETREYTPEEIHGEYLN